MTGEGALTRAFGRVVSVKPHEVGGLLASFLTVFCMFTGYAVLRPVRETMGITQGVANLPYLKLSRKQRCLQLAENCAAIRHLGYEPESWALEELRTLAASLDADQREWVRSKLSTLTGFKPAD